MSDPGAMPIDEASPTVERPTLTEWMKGAVSDHPLWPLLKLTDPGVKQVLDVLDELLSDVQGSAPLRWQGKRRDFRNIRTEQQLLNFRAELVVAAKLARGGVTFEFGDTSTANPDLVLPYDLGIEVTAKSPEGVGDLDDDLEKALEPWPEWSVHLRFSDYPVRLKPDVRARAVEEMLTFAERVLGEGVGGVVQQQVTDPRNGQPLTLAVDVLPVPSLEGGLRVTWETISGQLSVPLAAVEREVFSIFQNDAKVKQAQTMPTVLAVDIARLGAGWMRPMSMWADTLAGKLPPTCPFVAVAVMRPSLDVADAEIGLGVAPSASVRDRSAIATLAADLGLAPSPTAAGGQ